MAEVLQQTSFAPLPLQSGPDGYASIDQMPAFSFPSCSVNKNEPDPNTHTSSSFSKATSQTQRSHRRARTSVHASPALPAFSFGAASPDNEPEPATPGSAQDTVPQSLFPPRTPTSRHRRAVSELVGEPSNEYVTPSQSAVPGFGNTVPALLPQAARHRHRRSGAVSSQDLSALQRPLPIDERPASPDKSSDTLNPARAVEFSDHVEVIPRPQSMISSSSGSSHSTLKAFESSRASDAPDQQRPYDLPPSMQDTPPEHAASFDLSSEPSMNVDIVELNEDFDNDPTSTIVSHAPQHSFEQTAEAFPSLIPSTSDRPSPIKEEAPRDDIDLDFASVDNVSASSRSPIRGSSFQRARASMHSAGGHFSGFMAHGYQGHRRAESAPSLAPVSFGFRNGADISHEMPAVFEDPEEDDADTPPQRSDTPDCRASFVSSTASSPDQDSTPRALAGRRAVHSSPNLLPPIDFQSSRTVGDERDDARMRHSADEGREALRLPKPSFIVTEEHSTSAKSSPKYAHSYISSSEPSPGFQHSVEDVPSLISCGSTIGSSTVQQTRPSLSAPSLDHGIAKSTSSLAPSSRAGHRKRLSIMSMSMSKLFTTNAPKSDDTTTAEPQAQRSQSTAGLTPPSPSKGRRLSRILKIFGKKSSP